jgi:hypothetical protein
MRVPRTLLITTAALMLVLVPSARASINVV